MQELKRMRKFSIVSREDEKSVKTAKYIQQYLFRHGMSYTNKDPDIVCVVGGDGTFLAAVNKYVSCLDKVYFTGINTGTFGFFSDYQSDEVEEYLEDILNKEPEFEEKRLLRIEVSGKNNRAYLAVNEMRVENIAKTQSIDVFVDDHHLETYRGSGLCICTQTGSTAFNRSLKGAVVENGLEILELTEITGIHHSMYRSLGTPLILAGNRRVRLEANFDDTTVMCFDRYSVSMAGVNRIECTLSDQKVKIAHYRNADYIEHLYHLF